MAESTPAPVAKTEEKSGDFFKNVDTTGKALLFTLAGAMLILIVMLLYTLVSMRSSSHVEMPTA